MADKTERAESAESREACLRLFLTSERPLEVFILSASVYSTIGIRRVSDGLQVSLNIFMESK